jgi:molybdopterin converting factor small subunit
MAEATITLPSMLSGLVGVPRQLRVEAPTLAAALRALVQEHPALGVHLFDETGSLRQHVLCFHNGTNSRWIAGGDRALGRGDSIRIVQAVSGG